MDLDVHLAAIVAGDTRAFGSWMAGAEARVRDSLRSFAQVVDTEAVLQETLLRTWQVAPRLVADGRPDGLLRMAIRIGRSPEKGGSEWKFLSNRTPAMPRRKIEAPMVMMIRVTTEASRAGRTPKRSIARPTATASAIAASAASGSGTPAAATNTVAMPPIMTNSPWAKLITWLAL